MSVPNADTFNLKSFDFDDLKLSDDDTTLACLRIFIDLDLISKFQIPYKVNGTKMIIIKTIFLQLDNSINSV